MPKLVPEYRADHLACPLNAAKLEKVRDLVVAMRRTATHEARVQWTQFYRSGWKGFESQAKKGWTRPWVADGTLNTTFSQQVMSQVAASLKGHLGNVRNTYAELVQGSSLPADIRHQLHAINRRQAWFWRCPVKVRPGIEVHGQKRERDVLVSDEVRAWARTVIRRALAMHRKPHFRRFQPQLDQRSCFVQSAHTANHPLWLTVSTLAGKEKMALPLMAHAAFLERNAQSALYGSLARGADTPPQGAENARQAARGEVPSFLDHMRRLDAPRDEDGNPLPPVKPRNPYPSNLAVPDTVRLMLSDDHRSLRIGMVSDMRAVFEHQVATYQPRCKALALDLGLCTLLATDDGELHGRNWIDTLCRFDSLLTGIARHRQRLGLPVASERYRFHAQRLRGWLKTEIHRIVNRLIDRKRPETLIVEKLDFFRSPRLSRRLNRLVSNFGKGILTAKLVEIEKQMGIAVEHRDAAYTSQQCESCGYIDTRNRKTQAQFHCLFCNTRCQADVQASRVLRHGRSVSLPHHRLSRQHLLVDRVSLFNARYTRPRGGPADPRFTNPHFRDWANAQSSPETGWGPFGEVISGQGCPEKKAA